MSADLEHVLNIFEVDLNVSNEVDCVAFFKWKIFLGLEEGHLAMIVMLLLTLTGVKLNARQATFMTDFIVPRQL